MNETSNGDGKPVSPYLLRRRRALEDVLAGRDGGGKRTGRIGCGLAGRRVDRRRGAAEDANDRE